MSVNMKNESKCLKLNISFTKSLVKKINRVYKNYASSRSKYIRQAVVEKLIRDGEIKSKHDYELLDSFKI